MSSLLSQPECLLTRFLSLGNCRALDLNVRSC
ncbi:hypothetical protein Golob_023844, partial [Gossypium lobatum]|nr:hypothetical protein [Gossypium lobatum]